LDFSDNFLLRRVRNGCATLRKAAQFNAMDFQAKIFLRKQRSGCAG
jgi:hypothetical protein